MEGNLSKGWGGGGGERYGLGKREKWPKNVEKGEISERRKAKWVKTIRRRKDREKNS